MKTLIIFISILFSATYMYAQTNYYATTKTFNQDGYIYQCDVRASGFVTLYNKSNKLINVYPVYKNTGESFVQTDAGINCLRVILGHAQNVFLLLMLHFLIVKNKE